MKGFFFLFLGLMLVLVVYNKWVGPKLAKMGETDKLSFSNDNK